MQKIAMKKLFYILLIPVLFTEGCSKENAAAPPSAGAGGSTARFTIAGNYLYVVDHSSLKTFSIANTSAAPVLQSTTDVGINIETIFPYQDKLFIGSSSAMYIYSLASPERPQKLAEAQYMIRMSCDPVVAKDSTAYATLNASGPCGGSQSQLVVYNIKDITRPVFQRALPLTAPHGLGISDSALYVCEGAQGLNVYGIRNTYNPQFLRTLSGDTFYDVIPYGNILVCQLSNGIALYDISNRYQPSFLSRISN